MPTFHVALGAFRAMSPEAALEKAARTQAPVTGRWSLDHVQLCPQNSGVLDEERLARLRARWPKTRFRLHANVNVGLRRAGVSLATVRHDRAYYRRLTALNRILGDPPYVGHAGRRSCGSLQALFDNTRRLADMMGAAVGVEGLYPPRGALPGPFQLSTWDEYAALLDARVHYAVDLSHLHILACATGRLELGLVRELVASEWCLEVHVSANDGETDAHERLVARPWWWTVLADIHPQAVIFTEERMAA